MKKTLLILITLAFASFTFSQSVEIKDSDSHILIQINDEGTAGSITIPDATTVSPPTTDKLYNEGGTLKWNGTEFSTGPHTVDTDTWRGIDDIPVNSQYLESITSNWAYDHSDNSSAHHTKTINTNATTECPPGEILTGDGTCIPIPSSDNLGNHIATQDVNMAGFEVNLNGGYLSGDGDNEGVYVYNTGIIDFNKQSKARASLSLHAQSIPFSIWTPVEFDDDKTFPGGYDVQSEFTPSIGTSNPGVFTASTSGFYQINARTEFNWYEIAQQSPVANGYVSIAIFVNGVLYARGNNLAMEGNVAGPLLFYNNAPNVSDIAILKGGDVVQIMVWQSVDNKYYVPLGVNSDKTYVSIHKIS